MEKESIKIDEKDNSVLIYVNPEIYPLDVIYSAAYVFLDSCYILLDGDSKREIIVKLNLKNKMKTGRLYEFGKEFFNELLSYAFYKSQAEKNFAIRQAILQSALFTPEEDLKDTNDDSDDFIEDPEGIAIPWEEKYGKNN